MYRKLDKKILAAIFAMLLLIVVLIELADSRKGSRTFREKLVDVDAEELTSIEIYPKVAGNKLIRVIKENDTWKVEGEGKKYHADQSLAVSMVNELNNIKPESVVATKEERWQQYEVTDSLGTRVIIYSGVQKLAELIIGKFSFSQPRKMTSYVRLTGEKEVYGVDGMLGMSFNRNLNAFRDRTVIRSSSADWKKLIFTYPADSSFVLEKVDNRWLADGQPADSALVVDYISSVRNLSDSRFADYEPEITPTHKLFIESDSQKPPIEINGFYSGADSFLVESSQNQDNYFDSSELAEKIFVPVSKFFESPD